MSDIATIWFPADNRGDWQITGGALQSGDDLVTAVLISLFTDGRAHADDVLTDGTNDRRGWWGDLDEDVPIGSRLWLLERAKATTETLNAARNFIAEALQWLIDDGVAASVDVDCQWNARSFLAARVTISKSDGSTVALNFEWAWQGNR